MATLVVQQQHQNRVRQSPTPPPTGPQLKLNVPRASTPVPNKHIPYCPAGSPSPSSQTVTPPNSPPKSSPGHLRSILHPPTSFEKLLNSPPVFGLDAQSLASAVHRISMSPMPDPQHVFPWLHGLHDDNQVQLGFFAGKKKWVRRIPKSLRGITIIKAGGDLSRSKLKGSMAPDEILCLSDNGDRGFLECDPREGFSVRNFHIQAAKMARVSDIVVYGDELTDQRIVRSVAERTSIVQRRWKKELETSGQCPDSFHTFVLTTPFEDIERELPELIAIDGCGRVNIQTIDFLQLERYEMGEMSKSSEFSQGVCHGPTPDWNVAIEDGSGIAYDVFIEASDQAQLPDDDYLSFQVRQLETMGPIHVDFPSSGSIFPPSWSTVETDGIIRMCRWIYDLTHPKDDITTTPPSSSPSNSTGRNGDIQMAFLSPAVERKVLIHCADGYTESTLLSVAYYMYAEGVPVHTAWLQMHCDQKRNFFAYPSDVALLISIQEKILSESPARRNSVTSETSDHPPPWLNRMEGSLPSRILPYMYLGNLTHANNPVLLRKLGIRRILSIGEPVNWDEEERARWGQQNLIMVSKVQDNGIDPLSEEIESCLEFIARGKADNTATLVHCRVGVSRSATICIAEVMASTGLSFPRAYCFVRARRLNVIIQPHLRFVYELMKWDEHLQRRRGEPVQREMEWQSVCREIATINRPYSRS